MNHYLSLLLFSVCVSAVFSLITRQTRRGQILYFLKLMAYMGVGSLAAAWFMYTMPWS